MFSIGCAFLSLVANFRFKMPIKLVALDLDGTTLNNEHKLATATVSTLRKLSENGVIVCIATGRGLDESFYGYLKQLDLPQDEVPVVSEFDCCCVV